MKYYIFLLNFCLSCYTFSQLKIRVIDTNNQFRIEGAEVFNESKEFIGKTNEIGELEIKTSPSMINIVKNEYFSEVVEIENKNVVDVKLKPLSTNLETSFETLENPAHLKRKELLTNEEEISFDHKEKNTYGRIDSIGLIKYKLEKRLKLLRILNTRGKLPVGKIDIDLTKIIGYNDYEGFRIGAALSTNEKLSDKYSLNAYSAYGFQDRKVKFGVGGEYYVNKPYSGKFFAKYNQDVSPSGKSPILLQSNYTSFVSNAFSNIYNNEYFSYKTYSFGYQQDVFRNLTFNLSLNYEKQKAEFDYNYKKRRGWFQLYNTQLSFRYAPKDKFIRTPYGKVTVNNGKSVFYATIAKYWDVFDSNYSPLRINFSYFDVFDTRLGKTSFNLNADWIDGDIPIMNLYEGRGNAKHNGFLNFGVGGLNSFETMKAGEFYSDLYFSFNIKHIFAGIKVGNNKVILPQFIYRGVLGDMRNKENHENIKFNRLNNYFHEVGLEVNNIFFKTFGIGLYYRLGAYSEQKFQDNLHLKLTINLNLL